MVAAHAGRRRPGAAAAARARPEQGPGERSRVEAVQHDPDRLLIRRPVPAGEWIPRGPQPGQVRLAGCLIHWPTAVNRSFPAAVNAHTATATRQASG